MAWFERIRNALQPGRLERDLERELAFHVAERAEDLEASGASRTEATRAAQRQFGNFTAQLERTRDMDVNFWLESFLRNLRHGLRALIKTPVFSFTVIATLALGIGANSAVFSAIHAVLLRPLPFPNANQLVKLTQSHPKVPLPFVAPIRLEEWNRLNSTFAGIAGYFLEDASEVSGALPEKIKRAWVSPRFLHVLGIAPALGRNFSADEERFGGPRAVIISDRLRRRRFGDAANPVGKTLREKGGTFTIVGVMPPTFQFPDRNVDLWSPSPPDAPYAQNRESTWYTGIGRMKPGVTLTQARANLAAVQANLGRQYPKTDGPLSASLQPLKAATIGGVGNVLWLLFGSVSLLLLIACTNIAAMVLSRAVGRRHEIALRFSLGASRGSVAAQLLTEVFLLAVAGAALGLAIAYGASQVFRSLAKDLPRIDEIGLNSSIVLYSLACAVAVTLLSGIVPVIFGTRRSLGRSLAEDGRAQVSGRSPLRFLLVGVQVALAVTLLTGAGLLFRSFQELERVSPGFNPQQVLAFHVSSSWAEAYGKVAQERTRRLLEGLRSVPGVEAATIAISLAGVPGEFQLEFKTAEGRAESEPKMFAQSRVVEPAYFSTMSIPILDGAVCRQETGTASAMVNRSFASLYLNGSGAIGRHLIPQGQPNAGQSEIRGIVGDARETGLDRDPEPTVYWCAASIQPAAHFLVRTRGEPTSVVGAIRRKVYELEPQRSVYDFTPLTAHISEAYAEHRLRTVLLAFFALTAISLASVGLYGTLSYLVNVRQREVALRIALGALRIQVVRQFLGQGLRVSLLGCLAGLVLAAALARMLSGMLFGVSSTDTMTFVSVVTLVLAVSGIASLLPAIRAARLEPMQALREE